MKYVVISSTEFGGTEGPWKRPRVFVSGAARNQRQFAQFVKPVLRELFAEENIVFDRKAGCPCGCSPGFIRKDGPLTKAYGTNVVLGVTDE